MAGEDTPLRGAEPPAPAAAPARQAANAALELGHNCALLLAFFDGLGTGVQQILFLFFLVDVGGYPIERAAGVAARGWLLYALCQLASAPGLGALADRVGRRPVLLWGALVDALVMSLSYVPNAEWWVASHALMGCFDATAAMCNAVVVDSVVRRADDDDDAAPRGLGDIRAALSRGLGGLFVVGGLGRLRWQVLGGGADVRLQASVVVLWIGQPRLRLDRTLVAPPFGPENSNVVFAVSVPIADNRQILGGA